MTTDKNSIKVGDLLVDSDQIYKVYSVEHDGKEEDGKNRKLLNYRPLSRDGKHDSLTCSIPEVNMFKAGLRRPLTKEQIELFMEELQKKTDDSLGIDYKLVKEVLFLNDPLKTAPLLKQLWENKGKGDVYSRTDEELLESILHHLVAEIAMVLNISEEKALQKIEKSGKKH